MKIYLDIDGVCGDFFNHFFAYLSLPSHPVEVYHDERFNQLYRVQHDKDFWLSMPILNKPEFTPTAYMTSRPIPSHVTTWWLAKNGFPFAPVFTTENKAELLPEDGVMIDDAPHHFDQIVKAGKRCLLFDALYNRHIDTQDRIYSLTGITL